MQKRKILFDTYDTAADGLWTLASCVLGDAEPEEIFLEIPGRLDGPLDASEALTGDVQYGPRPLTVMLESSEGTRTERQTRINTMVNRLHGKRAKIVLPDDEAHYLVGRLKVTPQYNDLAHAAVQVTATCEPWRYAAAETFVSVRVSPSSYKAATLRNDGRTTLVPRFTVEDYDETNKLEKVEIEDYEGNLWTLTDYGSYSLPGLVLKPGDAKMLTCSGACKLTITYREAAL